jgi:Kef-type K+ transport system membrane component KefB
MKDLAASVIGILFAIAIVAFFGLGMLPTEWFCSLATGAIVWFFKDRETAKLLKELKELRERIK